MKTLVFVTYLVASILMGCAHDPRLAMSGPLQVRVSDVIIKPIKDPSVVGRSFFGFTLTLAANKDLVFDSFPNNVICSVKFNDDAFVHYSPMLHLGSGTDKSDWVILKQGQDHKLLFPPTWGVLVPNERIQSVQVMLLAKIRIDGKWQAIKTVSQLFKFY